MSDATYDIHICGSCRQQFISLSDFIEHKHHTCTRSSKDKPDPHPDQPSLSLSPGGEGNHGNTVELKSESQQNEAHVPSVVIERDSEVIMTGQPDTLSSSNLMLNQQDLSSSTAFVQLQTPHGLQVLGNFPLQTLQDLQQQQLKSSSGMQWSASATNQQLAELQVLVQQQLLQDQQTQQLQQFQQQQDYIQLPFLQMTLSESQQSSQASSTSTMAPSQLVPAAMHDLGAKTLEAIQLLTPDPEQQLVLQSLIAGTAGHSQQGDRSTTTVIDIQSVDTSVGSTVVDVVQVADDSQSKAQHRVAKSLQQGKDAPGKMAWKVLQGSPVQDGTEKGQQKYHCLYPGCSYETQYAKNVDRHLLIHTGEKPFHCLKCESSFSRADKLKCHQRTHTGEKPYHCNHCDYKCGDKGSLKKHLRTHTNERPFKCQICQYASRSSSQLTVHLRTHTGDKPFMCPECSATFKVKSDLKRHCRLHTGEKPFACSDCNFRTSVKSNLKAHSKTHHCPENMINCKMCDFRTSSKRNFRSHLKCHSMPDSKRLKCMQCDYTCFDQKLMLNHHTRHSNYRPHPCPYCNYRAKTRVALNHHLSNRHDKELTNTKVDTRKKRKILPYLLDSPGTKKAKKKLSTCLAKFKCHLCEAGFVREDSLRSHIRSHKEKDDYTALVQEAMQKQQQLNNNITESLPENNVSAISGDNSVVDQSTQRPIYSINQEHEYAAAVQETVTSVKDTSIQNQSPMGPKSVSSAHASVDEAVKSSSGTSSRTSGCSVHQLQQNLLPYIQNNHNMAVWDNMQNMAVINTTQDPNHHQPPDVSREERVSTSNSAQVHLHTDYHASTQQQNNPLHCAMVRSSSDSQNLVSTSIVVNGVVESMRDSILSRADTRDESSAEPHFITTASDVLCDKSSSSSSVVQSDTRSLTAQVNSSASGSAVRVLSIMDHASLPDDVGEVLKSLSLHKGVCQVVQIPTPYSTNPDQKMELLEGGRASSGHVSSSAQTPSETVAVQYIFENKEVGMSPAALENNNSSGKDVLRVIQPLYLPTEESSQQATQPLYLPTEESSQQATHKLVHGPRV